MTKGKTIKEIIKGMVHEAAKFDTVGAILERINIPRDSYNKYTNENREDTSPPIKWVAPLTNLRKDYSLIEKVARDCGGVFIPLDEIEGFEENSEAVINAIMSIRNVLSKSK